MYRIALCTLLFLTTACAFDDEAGVYIDAQGIAAEGPYAAHEELSDFEAPTQLLDAAASLSVMPSTFNRDVVVWDGHFRSQAMDAAAVQRFLERTPYGRASWLARERVGGKSFATALVAAAATKQINPLMLLARIQVERSAISKTTRPKRRTDIDYIMGCGCPDNKPCQVQHKGLDKQMACAAGKLDTHFAASVAGNGLWNRGVAKQSLDRKLVTPGNHATAALYAYTPWVGNGGNQLVFNVTHKFTVHAQAQAR